MSFTILDGLNEWAAGAIPATLPEDGLHGFGTGRHTATDLRAFCAVRGMSAYAPDSPSGWTPLSVSKHPKTAAGRAGGTAVYFSFRSAPIGMPCSTA